MFHVEAGIGERLGDARGGQRDSARDVRPVLDLDILVFVEFLGDFACHLHREFRWIEAADPPHPAFPVLSSLPEPLAPNPIGAYGSDPCDRNPVHRIILPLD